ncbi:hypothetical protein FisN_21Lh188 [Fistulifera solaris]|uniref:Uncharacterized protein n=1 Tax=Fistulifera solaris TaxID=1519565 RepID=A0A1Z5J923_FISSO|nr:hypothetical protein FisN_21Lh188 [Fistulifera solaris]|eukprot:GAX10487.1 hypothetical protein FisN_21Lh188 [Fistulifera solaris]
MVEARHSLCLMALMFLAGVDCFTFTNTISGRAHVALCAVSPREPKGELYGGNSNPEPSSDTEQQETTIFQSLARNLAQLSLQDYKWRSDIFKAKEAERMLEQSLARMRGEDPMYVRPMDASESSLGPLGRWEKSAVEWLSQVVEEEGRRAERIVNGGGQLVRPKDAGTELGPLGFLESAASDFLDRIKLSESERVRTKTIRPKDLDESMRGPLGEAEYRAVRIFEEIRDAELLRMSQSRRRGGEVVRPLDVPGPLGELEAKVLELFDAEQKRAAEKRMNAPGVFLRPKDAKYKGPLGEAEQKAYETLAQLSDAERLRLKSIQRILEEKRPMDNDRNSPLGILETFIVGLVRAPILLVSVLRRVVELLQSQPLDEADELLARKDEGSKYR